MVTTSLLIIAAMGEGMADDYRLNPMWFFCVGCDSESFYYGNCLFDLVLCGIYFVPVT